jgi:uncharacterized protein YfaP (DUF2135 family)
MRFYRAAAVTVAALALTYVSACKKDATSNGPITCSDSPICPSGSLSLGLNQPSGAPTIVPTSSSTNVSTSTSGYVVVGTTSATANGYWLLVQGDVVVAWGVLAVSSGTFAAEIPLFCGAQQVYYAFTNGAGTSYYYLNANLTGCAGPSQFRVQLTWVSNPSSDLDLHLVRPGGVFASGNDCYFGNCTGTGLTWGSGNPRLDVDDTDGFGPENIYLTTGAESGLYRVIIHDWDGTVGEVATVRIYFNDVQAAVYTSSPALDATTHRYWEVAKVNVATRQVTPVNVFTSTPPTTLGQAPPAWAPIAK